MTLVIDSREIKIKNLLSERNNIEIEVIEQCDLGDFIFYRDSSKTEVLLIIERKTISDLYSSINDGRHREQKIRLMSNYRPKQIIYLIENDIDLTDNRYKIIKGAILNSILRDNLKVIKSKNLIETCYILETIQKKIQKNPNWFIDCNNSINDNIDYCSTIKIKKKENLTPLICQILQLSQIPGLSKSVAKIIIEKYECLSNLILSYTKCETIEEKDQLLKDIIIKTTTGKERKLGKVLSSRIYNYLFLKDIENNL